MSTDQSQKSEPAGPLVQFYRWVFGIGHERNVGGPERAVRYTLGGLSVLGAVAVLAVPVLDTLANLALSLAFLVTGAYLIYEARVQYCPMNHTLGRSTYREER